MDHNCGRCYGTLVGGEDDNEGGKDGGDDANVERMMAQGHFDLIVIVGARGGRELGSSSCPALRV